jgi:hypothetical protein
MFVEGPVTLAIYYVIGCSSVDGPLPLILDQGKSENASQILEAQEHIFSNLKDSKQKCSLFPIRSTYLGRSIPLNYSKVDPSEDFAENLSSGINFIEYAE